MAYLVSITVRAERDLALLYDQINVAESEAAQKWYRGLRKAIMSLARQPARCPTTPESRSLRRLLYGHKPDIYRVIYRVLEKPKRVEVLHIRHGARRGFRRPDVK